MTRHMLWISAAWLMLLIASFGVDRPVAGMMVDANPTMLAIFAAITWFGQGGVILLPAAAIMLISAALRWLTPSLRSAAQTVFFHALAIFAVVAAAGIVNDILKMIFARSRPHLWLTGEATGFHFLRYSAKFASFPSGHTATSVAAAIIFSALFPRARWFFIVCAILIACSRIVLNMHYVSDVVAAAGVGGLVAVKMLDQMSKTRWSPTRNRQDGAREPRSAGLFR